MATNKPKKIQTTKEKNKSKRIPLYFPAPNRGVGKSYPSKIFIPDPDLLKFAKEFSDAYKILSPGYYSSNNKKYHIDYLPRIKDPITNKISDTGIRIWNKSGIIELDKTFFNHKKFTSDFIFYQILVCVIYNEHSFDIHKADELAVECYITTGRSKKNLMIGMGQLVKQWGESLVTISRLLKMNTMLGNTLITSGYRTAEEQEILTKNSPKPPSRHNQ